MKTKTLIILIFLLFFACSEEEVLKLEVYSPEAFAFQLDESWELNASVQVKSFMQEEQENSYTSKLSYYVNLTTSSGELLEEVDYGLVNKSNDEKMTDLQVDIQIVLDSSFKAGEYEIEIYVLDDLAGQKESAKTKFELSNN